MKRFKAWLAGTTVGERLRVAKLLGWDTPNMFTQIKSGRCVPSAELAAKMERAIIRVTPKAYIAREDLSPVCAKCPYAPDHKRVWK